MSENEKQVYDFILEYKMKNNGNSPSLDQIAEGLGLGKSTVNYHLDRMEAKGVLKQDGVKSITIPNSEFRLKE